MTLGAHQAQLYVIAVASKEGAKHYQDKVVDALVNKLHIYTSSCKYIRKRSLHSDTKYVFYV